MVTISKILIIKVLCYQIIAVCRSAAVLILNMSDFCERHNNNDAARCQVESLQQKIQAVQDKVNKVLIFH